MLTMFILHNGLAYTLTLIHICKMTPLSTAKGCRDTGNVIHIHIHIHTSTHPPPSLPPSLTHSPCISHMHIHTSTHPPLPPSLSPSPLPPSPCRQDRTSPLLPWEPCWVQNSRHETHEHSCHNKITLGGEWNRLWSTLTLAWQITFWKTKISGFCCYGEDSICWPPHR